MSDIFTNFPAGLQLWPQARLRSRNLQEGYSFSLLENSNDTYHFSVLADPARVQTIFNQFTENMPDEAFFILEFYTTEPNVKDTGTSGPDHSLFTLYADLRDP